MEQSIRVHRRVSKYDRGRATRRIHFLITIAEEVKPSCEMRNGNGQEIKAGRVGGEKRDSRVYSIRIPNEKAESGCVCSGIEGQRMTEWSVSCLRNRERERTTNVSHRGTGSSACKTRQDVCRAISYARASIASIRDRTSTSRRSLISHGI